MPSPDSTAYVNLTLFDRDPTDLLNRALTDAASKLPSWKPQASNTEVVVLESMALIVAELSYALNRLPNAMMSATLNLYGAGIDPGAAPTTNVQFSRSATASPATVPLGSTVQLTVGTSTITFITTTDAVFAAGAATATAAATGNTFASVFNGTPVGTALTITSSTASVADTASVAAVVSGGRDPEDTAAWFTRAVNILRRVSSALVNTNHFEAFALGQPGVARAHGINNYDPTTGNANALGHITVAVSGSGGTTLPTSTKTAMQAAMQSLAQTNLAVHVIDPTLTSVPVTAQVTRQVGFDVPTVTANVQAALAAYLSPDSWAWGASVTVPNLVGVIDRAAGVQSATVSIPAATVVPSGVAALVTLGTVQLTVS